VSSGVSNVERLRCLDVFRGMTVAGMILVSTPGDPDSVYAPLRHARWDGWTVTDLIFPFFLFIVGVSMSLSNGRDADIE
jgi:predicted acyltransferase